MLLNQYPRRIEYAVLIIALVGIKDRQRQLVQLTLVTVGQDALLLQCDDKTGDGCG